MGTVANISDNFLNPNFLSDFSLLTMASSFSFPPCAMAVE